MPASLLLLRKFNLLSAYGISLNHPLRGTSPKAAYLASKRTCVRQLIAFMPNSQTNRNFIPLNCVLLQPNTKCRAGELFCGTKIFPNLSHLWAYKQYSVLCYFLLFVKIRWDWLHYWTQVRKFFYTSPCCGTVGIPILDFWYCLPWVFNTRVDQSLACSITCMQWISQIHLWCCTYWSLLTASSIAAELFGFTCFLDN